MTLLSVAQGARNQLLIRTANKAFNSLHINSMTVLFGVGDILAGLLFVAGFYQLDLPQGMSLTLGIYLMAKGLLFIFNFFSLIDIAAGVLLAFGLLPEVHPFVLLGAAAFLCLKGLISLFAFS